MFPPMAAISGQDRQLFTRADWLGGYQSLHKEYSYWLEQIVGRIPLELEGTLFRNGPGKLDVGGEPYGHPFDGDGMVCRLSLVEGRAHFANSFVKTPEFLREQQAGKILYRGVFGTQKAGGWWANAFDLRRKNVANTNVIYHGGKLLALWEADRPYRLDPRTLATIGIEDFGGELPAGAVFTAHPRRDPDTGDIWAFGVSPSLRSLITIYRLGTNGQLETMGSKKVAGFCFLHDFAWTENYSIFLQNPVQFNPVPFLLGWQTAGACLELRPNTPSQFLIFAPDGNLQVLDTDPCFVFHHANAFFHHGQLIVDAVTYADYPKLEPNLDFRDVNFDKVIPGKLCRFLIDLATGRVTRSPIFDRSCEFPCLNPNYVGKAYRYLYLGAVAPEIPPTSNGPLQAIVKVDVTTGNYLMHSFAPRGFIGEPVFIPRGTEEDDGWLITFVFNGERRATDIVILSAQDLSTCAVLPLPHHVPYGLHGNFVRELFL